MATSDNLQIRETLLLDDDAVMKIRDTDGNDTTFSNANIAAVAGLSSTNLAALTHTAGTGVADQVMALDSSGNFAMPATGEFTMTGNKLGTEAGTGITGGTGTLYKSRVVSAGGIITTMLLIDLTGLDSDAALGDIIGVDGTANPCHLGAITTAQCGTIFGGKMVCLEAPTTGEVDIDLYSADEATGVTDDAISGLSNGVAVVASAADWTLLAEKAVTGIPTDGQYLYLTVGTDSTPTANTYDAGKFLIELYGY